MSSRDPLRRADDAVLYGAAFAATVASTLALTSTVAVPELTSRALTAVTAGFAISWVMHTRGIRSRTLPYLLLVVALVLLSPWWRQPERFNTLIPQEFIEERDLRLAGIIFVFAALRTFSLVTRGDLLFCVVPGLSMFGVMAYRRPDSEFMALFVVFILASAYLVGYDHLLDVRLRVEAPAAPDGERVLRRDHLIATTALCVACLVLASGAALPLRLAGERYRAVLGVVPTVTPRPAGEAPGYMLGGDTIPIGAGPVALGDSEILRVRTNTPGNWRLKVYDEYGGRTWGRGTNPVIEHVPGTAGEFDFEGFLRSRRSPEQQYCQVLVIRGDDSNIASPAPAIRLNLHLRDRPAPDTAYLDRHGTVSFGGLAVFRRGDWYEVTAQAGAEVSTRRIGTTATNTRSLHLPFRSLQVTRLVEDITGHLDPTDHVAKVRAIQDHLIQNCRYNKRAPALPRTEKDAVEYFLFKSNEGDCDLFATALCVMCRLADVPARFVAGYAPGEPDPGGDADIYVVRERDSHAWAEVFLEGAGWVTVDPTVGAATAAERKAKAPWMRVIGEFLRRHSRAIGVLAAIGLALYLIAHLRVGAQRTAAPVRTLRGPSGDVIGCYQRACRSLARAGCPRANWQTPVEHAAACRDLPLLATAWPFFEELTWLFVKARYARSGADPEDAQRASLALAALRAGLRQGQRNVKGTRHTPDG